MPGTLPTETIYSPHIHPGLMPICGPFIAYYWLELQDKPDDCFVLVSLSNKTSSQSPFTQSSVYNSCSLSALPV